MKEFILFTGFRGAADPVFSAARNKAAHVLSWVFMSLGMLTLHAQTTITVPNLTASSGFTGVFASTGRTYQLIIDDSQLTALNGKYLTSISFRLPSNATSNWPATDATFPSYEIYLSDGVEPPNRQLNFAANVVGTQTQVRSGTLFVPAGALTSGSDPNAFSFLMTFDTPWLYSGTNLVIELRHTGNDISSSRSTNSTGTSTPGYGTLFTACWQGTGNVSQGNFSFVQINAVDTMGVKSVTIDAGGSVYPNPVNDILFLSSSADIIELQVYNFAGQKIYSKKNGGKISQLNVSGFASGHYLLQLTDKNGNSTSTRFIKK